MGELGGVEQPPEECFALAGASEAEQGVEGRRAVPNPGVSIVPVAYPAKLFGQGGGRRGGDRPRRGMNQELQGKCAAHHRLAPRTFVAALPRPPAPVVKSFCSAPLDGAPRREDKRVAMGHAQRQESLDARLRSELTLDRVSAALRLAGLEAEYGNGLGPGIGDGDSQTTPDMGPTLAVAEARL